MTTDAKPAVIKLAGIAYPVDTSLPRLQAIETWTGVSIFALVKAGANRDLSIDQMAMIAACLIVAPAGDPLVGHVPNMVETAAMMPLPAAIVGPVAKAIMEAGLVATVPALIHPLAKAIGLEPAEG